MQIKQALVGYGRRREASSDDGQDYSESKESKLDDTADAVAAAICHAHSRNSRVIKIRDNDKKYQR